MKNFELTPEEAQELHAALKEAKRINARAAYKINAVLLLGTGWSIDEVIAALFLDDETVRTYVNKYKEDGIKCLLDTNYKGSKPKLSDDQINKLCEELDNNIYLTTKEICLFVKLKFQIEYTESGMADLLRRLDYVYKKPKLVPSNPDEEAKEIFLEQYLDFMKNKKENEAVFFVDAVHPTHNSMPAYGWMRKGKDTELKSNSGRSRLNIHGAMNAETFETTVILSEENVNGDSTIALLSSLEQLYPFAVAIYIILDNAKYHFSLPVQQYLKKSRIKLVFLPSYTPEFNLIERLWKVFKKNVLYNKFYETFDEFKKSCLGFFKNQAMHFDEIQSVMGDGLEVFSI